MSTIDTTFDRYCEGEDQQLIDAQDALTAFHNGVFNGSRTLNWHTLSELERGVMQAALNAGYRMALADVRASLARRGGA